MSLVGHIGGQAAGAPAVAAWLTELAVPDPDVIGGKATALARARAAGLPVLDGFVIPVEHPGPVDADDVRAAWARLSEAGTIPLVVRSSAPAEDGATSSMAGVFDSVLDVRGWDDFVDAVGTVRASAGDGPMAVLVQRMIRPSVGGVLFGVDPVTGRTDRWSIAVVEGGPHHLVDGSVAAAESVVDRSGRAVSRSGADRPALARRRRLALVSLERRARQLFGGPQDIEWAVDDGRLVLLQSRPVTAVGAVGVGPLLGPGPIAETHPEALDRLELDLWVPPLRDAVHEALVLLGQARRSRLARTPAVLVVDRQVVADLDATGDVADERGRLLRIVDPRPGLRRLRAAWRVGRLRAALPTLGHRLVERVDAELAGVPPLDQLGDDELLHLLANGSAFLRSVHAHEMLAGGLLDDAGSSAAEAGLDALAAGRARGWPDDDIVARTPEVLALVTPRIGRARVLPPTGPTSPRSHGTLSLRESLRLRARWLHELHRRVAAEAGARLVQRGLLDEAALVTRLDVSGLDVALRDGRVRLADPPTPATPLPARFRLSADGAVVAERAGVRGTGIPAGGGRGRGRVAHEEPRPGDVLVVRTLDPSLAALLPTLGGLVAETGSTLSHLAILAREQGVPVVVAVDGARDRYPEGTRISVDGDTGAVQIVERDA